MSIDRVVGVEEEDPYMPGCTAEESAKMRP